jgi:cell wall-associated NlpC family hydrolase
MSLRLITKCSFCFALLLLLIAASCKTPSKNNKHKHVTEHHAVNNNKTNKAVVAEKPDFYTSYSKKFRVKLIGTENKKLVQCMAGWLGTPYKYAGETKQGCDCSGMVMAIYKETYGKELFRSAMDQMKNVRIITRNELALGDLVFFKINGDKVSHVGIYIGESKFMHASTTRGVVINSLEEDYYKKWFFAGGRVAVN